MTLLKHVKLWNPIDTNVDNTTVTKCLVPVMMYVSGLGCIVKKYYAEGRAY